MAALTKDLSTPRRDGKEYAYPATAAVKAYAGALMVLDASGNCKPGVAATGLIAVGRAKFQADNSSGSAAAINFIVESGVFKWNNSSAGDLIAKTEIGKLCYIVDDNTVAKTDNTGTRSKAGIVVQVDTDGVWVYIGPDITGAI